MLSFSLDPKEIGFNPLICVEAERVKEIELKKADVIKSLEGLTLSESLFLLQSIKLGDLMNCFVLCKDKIEPHLTRFYGSNFSNKEV